MGMTLASRSDGFKGALVAKSVERRTLELAASLVGGTRKLRDVLGVPSEKLVAWLSGNAAPPRAVFLKALDLVLDRIERDK